MEQRRKRPVLVTEGRGGVHSKEGRVGGRAEICETRRSGLEPGLAAKARLLAPMEASSVATRSIVVMLGATES